MTEPGTEGVSGYRDIDEALLDDPARIDAADPGFMLRAIASGGPQLREAMSLAAEADLASLADEGRPRSLVVAGAGTAARTGDVLAAVAGPRCPVPVVAHRSAGVPGWVGAADTVLAVSASGRSPEALAAAEAAARRGARLVAIGAPGSELAAVAERARAPFIPVPRRAPARASLWALTVPVLLAGRALGLLRIAEADLAEAATRLDDDAERCKVGNDAFTNPAKALALDLANSLPVVWGSTPLAAVAAGRFAEMLAANARYPSVADSLLEAGRGSVGLLDGVFGALAESQRDIFADEPSGGGTRLRLVILRDDGFESGTPAEDSDGEEPPAVESRRAEAVQSLAERRGVRCTVLRAEGASPLERLASLTAIPDFASVYLALAHGFDPMAVPAVSEMKDFVTP
ncbi:SIS domain-containing protein [Actinocatenispora comari]|uniref:Bifunctional glucose-6-phosphate/mannose-6-phosphate isomerase n=1 Tax=Actinocatenispora comari TaxID=2807577 RepID=A0A8J4A4J5_9ACTN|nr:SIS domain-containing protein [Actinocatenispora comari]GIL24926.1 bifunctional glucose-6-phosphate/mannose-6-phosphate isomerase [Actinocatenispora comari]